MSIQHILIITPYYEPVKGGITTFAVNLKKEFSKQNFSVMVITNRGKGSEGVVSIEQRKIPFIIKTHSAIRKIKPDIIQCFSHWSTLAPAVIYKLHHPKTKVVFTFNTEILEKVGYIKRKIYGWLLSRSNCITFVSRYLMEEIQKKIEIKSEKKVIYDGATLNPSISKANIEEFKAKYEIKEDKRPIITSIAVFSYKLKVEGLKRLITAFKDIVIEYPNAVLIIIGDGRYRNELKTLVKNSQLQGNVVFTGYLDDVFTPLALSDMYVHVTLQEAGVADTILEAWAVEKPVIASNIGGIPEVVTHEEDGIIIEPTPNLICRSIKDLYKNKDRLSFISLLANRLLFGDGKIFNRARARMLSLFFNINDKAYIGKNVGIFVGKGKGLDDLYVGPYAYIYRNCEIITPFKIGAGSYLNRHSLISNTTIGENCAIGPGVIIGPATHMIGPSDRRAGKAMFLPVVIEDGVWIGARVVINGGIKIGRGSVVAAGAVVIKDVPRNVLVGGVPAKIIKKLE
jgi:acetyltransferase-like isoleucine patch superfamily enzyme